ncbi:MAG TPA: thaumatin family protein, partial [Kofleriaceae bacterium]
HLSLDGCPTDDDLGASYMHEDLRIRDGAGNVIACAAPCKKINYPAPYGHGQPENVDPGLHMCCPTPIDPASGNCTAANGCMSSEACRAASDPASVVHTDYVAALHAMCPSAYAFSYDDANGLHACPPDTRFEVTFCP